MKTSEIYEHVTNKIIHLLESHLEEWNKPWISVDQDNEPARNPGTDRYYRGINQFLLSLELMEKGYLKNIWMTYAQISDQGGQVLKSEKAAPVIFYKTAFIDRKNKYYKPEIVKTMDLNTRIENGIDKVPIIKLYHVFNVAQTKGLPDEYYTIPEKVIELNEIQKHEAAENLIIATGADVEYRMSNKAYFDPGSDKIVLPLREQFNSVEDLYGTSLHELIHWSGEPHRLNRIKGKVFGDQNYAGEELVAELGSAFLCANLGISKPITQNTAYIKNWLTVMKSNSRAIFSASAEAGRAVDYILELAGKSESRLELEEEFTP